MSSAVIDLRTPTVLWKIDAKLVGPGYDDKSKYYVGGEVPVFYRTGEKIGTGWKSRHIN